MFLCSCTSVPDTVTFLLLAFTNHSRAFSFPFVLSFRFSESILKIKSLVSYFQIGLLRVFPTSDLPRFGLLSTCLLHWLLSLLRLCSDRAIHLSWKLWLQLNEKVKIFEYFTNNSRTVFFYSVQILPSLFLT
jgi:hypothetical protein